MLCLNGQEEPGTQTLEEVQDMNSYLHGRERWCGISADQSGNNWALQAGLTPYRAISGLGVFGADPNDEAKLISTDDTPFISDSTHWEVHRIEVEAASNANTYVLRFVWHTTAMATGEGLGQYSDVMITEARKGAPVDITMPLLLLTEKLWARAKNATNNATIDFFIGAHEHHH